MEIVLKVLAFLLIFVRIFECSWAIYIAVQSIEYYRGMKTLSRLMFQTTFFLVTIVFIDGIVNCIYGTYDYGLIWTTYIW